MSDIAEIAKIMMFWLSLCRFLRGILVQKLQLPISPHSQLFRTSEIDPSLEKRIVAGVGTSQGSGSFRNTITYAVVAPNKKRETAAALKCTILVWRIQLGSEVYVKRVIDPFVLAWINENERERRKRKNHKQQNLKI